MNSEHHYSVRIQWQGNRGSGTSDYRSYGRQHLIEADGKHDISGSADRVFHGDRDRWNPEELLVAALAQCHMLSYLHVAASHGVVVTDYADAPVGTMLQTPGGGGHFTLVVLHPVVTVAAAPGDADAIVELAAALHEEAARKCFIAASMGFPVRHEATTVIAPA
jgi:organic hydroperoxide reductase OsmC/OhrA